MDTKQRADLMEMGIKRILFDSTMDQFTTFRVGGRAEAVCFPTERDQLQTLICWLNDEHIPYLMVGRGSNLLIRDGGYKGVVIILEGKLAAIERYGTDEQGFLAGGGLSIVELLSFCSSNGLAGLEFLAGIPGTVGGAVAMNAGAFGKEIAGLVRDIRILTDRGEWVVWDRAQLQFSYRRLKLPKGTVIVKIRFRLDREKSSVIRARIREYLAIRKENQPLEYPSGGSVFKNPPEYYAGKLIEQSGLKGKTIGGAAISLKHANFIINTGNAKAADILALIDLARKKIKDETGIELEPEIHVEGEDIH
jgi:UDP-N-acetylmuramate dehydrogenase